MRSSGTRSWRQKSSGDGDQCSDDTSMVLVVRQALARAAGRAMVAGMGAA